MLFAMQNWLIFGYYAFWEDSKIKNISRTKGDMCILMKRIDRVFLHLIESIYNLFLTDMSHNAFRISTAVL
jgi:hypothetical protein